MPRDRAYPRAPVADLVDAISGPCRLLAADLAAHGGRRFAAGAVRSRAFQHSRIDHCIDRKVWKVASLYRTRGRSGASPVTVGGAPAVVFWQRSHSTERIAGTTGVMGGGRWGPETVAFVLQAMMVRRMRRQAARRPHCCWRYARPLRLPARARRCARPPPEPPALPQAPPPRPGRSRGGVGRARAREGRESRAARAALRPPRGVRGRRRLRGRAMAHPGAAASRGDAALRAARRPVRRRVPRAARRRIPRARGRACARHQPPQRAEVRGSAMASGDGRSCGGPPCAGAPAKRARGASRQKHPLPSRSPRARATAARGRQEQRLPPRPPRLLAPPYTSRRVAVRTLCGGRGAACRAARGRLPPS